jgi:DNA-binding NtrC family response regulator
LDKNAAQVLFSYGWPGNLRELNRVIRGTVASCEGEILSHPEIFMEPEPTDYDTHPIDMSASLSRDSASPSHSPQEVDLRLKTAEKRHIQAVMEKMGGNKSRTAGALGISRSTLDRKLATYRS